MLRWLLNCYMWLDLSCRVDRLLYIGLWRHSLWLIRLGLLNLGRLRIWLLGCSKRLEQYPLRNLVSLLVQLHLVLCLLSRNDGSFWRSYSSGFGHDLPTSPSVPASTRREQWMPL